MLGAVRESDFYKSRTWSVKSGSAVNPISGKPTAYKLVPHARGAAGPAAAALVPQAGGRREGGPGPRPALVVEERGRVLWRDERRLVLGVGGAARRFR